MYANTYVFICYAWYVCKCLVCKDSVVIASKNNNTMHFMSDEGRKWIYTRAAGFVAVFAAGAGALEATTAPGLGFAAVAAGLEAALVLGVLAGAF